MPRNQVSLDEVLDAKTFNLKASIYKFSAGTVVAYYPGAKGKDQPSVDVQPGIHDVRIDTESGALVYEPWPILPRVPLAMPMSQASGAGMAFALAKGDHVTLLSFDQDPTTFRGTGNASPPPDTRRHGGGHWLALPFDITDGGAQPDPGPDLVVTPPAGGHVVVGPGATDFAALAAKVDANFAALVAALAPTVAIATPNDGGAGALSLLRAALQAMGTGFVATACTVLKVK